MQAALTQFVPFNGFIGLEVIELEPGIFGVVLPDDSRLHNHVGSQHAAGLFAAAEAGSGAAVLSVFGERLGELTPLARGATINYRKIAHGPITAVGALRITPDEILTDVDSAGKANFPVDVVLTNPSGETVAEVTVDWHLRRTS